MYHKHVYTSPQDLLNNYSSKTNTVWVKTLIVEQYVNLVKFTWLNEGLCRFNGYSITISANDFEAGLKDIHDNLDKQYHQTFMKCNVSENYKAEFSNNKFIDRERNNFFISFIEHNDDCKAAFCCDFETYDRIVIDYYRDKTKDEIDLIK